MPVVRIPKQAVTKVDMPAVCVATGATEGVSYQRRPFTFVPLWARLSVVFCGLIGLIFMLVSMKRVQVDVPFTDEAYRAWARAKWVTLVLLLGSVGLLFVPIFIDPDMLFVGFIAFIVGIIAAVVYSVTTLKQTGPICKEIDAETITLELPNRAAADAIERRLGLGEGPDSGAPPSGGTSSSPEDEDAALDARVQAELDRL